ncbi:protein kintoun isoform X2 [Haemorhous mexicanus]|uniref:protein kintoun isoform X2 n=1 Tax=Haemorhous mexicanus TaxID=30427 RepID=UPI0028BD2288|nr:protein kintoun isoform X2 [Haemorhous mexicanus]
MAGAGRLHDLDLSAEEAERLQRAFRDERFRALFAEYAAELTDPEQRRLYEEEVAALERERGVEVRFVHPTPGFVLRTSQEGSRRCYINVCSNPLMGEPRARAERGGQRWELPYSLAPGREELRPAGRRRLLYDVVFHPAALRLAARSARFRRLLRDTALEAVESHCGVQLDRNNATVLRGVSYKGVPQAPVIRSPLPGGAPKPPDDGESPLPPFPFPPAAAPPPAAARGSSPAAPPPPSGPTTPRWSIRHRSYVELQDYRHCRDSAPSPVPRELVVTVELPLLRSAEQAELEIRGRELRLDSQCPAYRLRLRLPYDVDESGGRAAFHRAQRQLQVTLPVVLPPGPREPPAPAGGRLEGTEPEGPAEAGPAEAGGGAAPPPELGPGGAARGTCGGGDPRDPLAEPPAGPPCDPPAGPSAEPRAEPPAELPLEPLWDPPAEPSGEPPVDPTSEAFADSSAEPPAEPAPDPASEPATDPTSESPAEPAPDPTSEPLAEPAPDPTSESAAEPAPDPASEPATDPTSETSPDPTSEPLAEPAPDPTSEPATDPTSEPASDPTSEPFADSPAEHPAEPAADPTSEPAPDPASEPAADPTSEPSPDPTSEPLAEPAPDPASESPAEPSTDPRSEPFTEAAADPPADPPSEPPALPCSGAASPIASPEPAMPTGDTPPQPSEGHPSEMATCPPFRARQDEVSVTLLLLVPGIQPQSLRGDVGTHHYSLRFRTHGAAFALFVRFPPAAALLRPESSVSVSAHNAVVGLAKAPGSTGLWDSFSFGLEPSALQERWFVSEESLDGFLGTASCPSPCSQSALESQALMEVLDVTEDRIQIRLEPQERDGQGALGSSGGALAGKTDSSYPERKAETKCPAAGGGAAGSRPAPSAGTKAAAGCASSHCGQPEPPASRSATPGGSARTEPDLESAAAAGDTAPAPGAAGGLQGGGDRDGDGDRDGSPILREVNPEDGSERILRAHRTHCPLHFHSSLLYELD